jgi:hypothetical protein
MANHTADLRFGKTEIFLLEGLDSAGKSRHGGEVICPSGRSGDGRIEMQTGQHRAIDGGEDDELDDQGGIKRQALNIDINQCDEHRDEHGSTDTVVMRVIKFDAGKKHQHEIEQF